MAALIALNRKKSGVNVGEPEKTAALKALKRKNSGINGGEPERSGVNGVELQKKRQ